MGPLAGHNASMTIFAVHYVYDSRTDIRDRVRPEHRRYLAGLLEAGVLLASGPFTGPTEGGGPEEPDGALLILRGESAADVTAALDTDPFALADVVAERTVRPWQPVMGPWA